MNTGHIKASKRKSGNSHVKGAEDLRGQFMKFHLHYSTAEEDKTMMNLKGREQKFVHECTNPNTKVITLQH